MSLPPRRGPHPRHRQFGRAPGSIFSRRPHLEPRLWAGRAAAAGEGTLGAGAPGRSGCALTGTQAASVRAALGGGGGGGDGAGRGGRAAASPDLL